MSTYETLLAYGEKELIQRAYTEYRMSNMHKERKKIFYE